MPSSALAPAKTKGRGVSRGDGNRAGRLLVPLDEHPHRTLTVDELTGGASRNFLWLDVQLMKSPAWRALSSKAREVYPCLLRRWEWSTELGKKKDGWTTLDPSHCDELGVSIKRDTLYKVMEQYAEVGIIDYEKAGKGSGRKNRFKLSSRWMEYRDGDQKKIPPKGGNQELRTCPQAGATEIPQKRGTRSLSDTFSEEGMFSDNNILLNIQSREKQEAPSCVSAPQSEEDFKRSLEALGSVRDPDAFVERLMEVLGDDPESVETKQTIVDWVETIGLPESKHLVFAKKDSLKAADMNAVYTLLKNRADVLTRQSGQLTAVG